MLLACSRLQLKTNNHTDHAIAKRISHHTADKLLSLVFVSKGIAELNKWPDRLELAVSIGYRSEYSKGTRADSCRKQAAV